MTDSDVDLRFPVGRYVPPASFTAEWRRTSIDAFAAAPKAMRRAVDGLDDAKLDTPYRPGGWSVRQVVHHVPDSHLNMYIRVKLALTEDVPTIKPYNEDEWAKLEDARTTPIETSLVLLESVHDRTVRIFQSLSEEQFQRRYVHPASGEHDLNYLIGLYAWHGAHHVAHITRLRDRMQW
ncbi:MAG: YfiT family bacillithiol transferase [Gemmatimonadaceae bacterium]